MEHENCENHRGPGPSVVVVKMALLAAVLGVGACARHLRHRHVREGNDVPGCRCPRHGKGGDRAERHDGHDGPRGCGCRDHRPAGAVVGPLEILATRFANGDIDEDEFRRRRDVVQENSH